MGTCTASESLRAELECCLERDRQYQKGIGALLVLEQETWEE